MPSASPTARAAIRAAKTRIGKPYLWGAAGPDAFDCSGLCYWAYAQAGYSWRRLDSYHMIRAGTPVSRHALLPGDLIRPFPGHIFLYLGNGKVIEAPFPGGHVRIVGLYGFHDATRLVPAGSSSSSSSGKRLRKGSKGSAVRRLQAGLVSNFPAYAGPIRRTGGADGVFGAGTDAVVREFQKRSGLVADGIVGPATRRELARYGITP